MVSFICSPQPLVLSVCCNNNQWVVVVTIFHSSPHCSTPPPHSALSPPCTSASQCRLFVAAMGYNTAGNDVDDLEKLRKAAAEIVARFGSMDNLLESLGLSDMPTAQRYGILFGFVVFTLTLAAVLALLVFGGSFQRLTEQSEAAGQPTTPLTAHDVRSQRALLLEELLASRERMLKQNYPPPAVTEGLTNLTSMLLNEAPRILRSSSGSGGGSGIGIGIGSDNHNKESKDADNNGNNYYIPPLYQENYEHAYRKCQDRPGGAYHITVPTRGVSTREKPNASRLTLCLALCFPSRIGLVGSTRGSFRSVRSWVCGLWSLRIVCLPSFVWTHVRIRVLRIPFHR